jgi:4a-hydroxytetrahydrobiopterin dehydratase
MGQAASGREDESMCNLASKSCVPCRGGVPPLAADRINTLLGQLDGWAAEQEHHITRTYEFPDFVKALEFVNQVGAIAEAEGHHPDVYLTWGRVRIDIWTHKINGLSESDFILAAKIDERRRHDA